MRTLKIDNYIIDTPIINIINTLQISLTNGKLRDIKVAGDNIVVTCPHHSGGHENKGALNIYIGDNTAIEYGWARCFVCDFQGPFVKFVAECFDKPENFAKAWLINNFGTKVTEYQTVLEPIKIKTTAIKKVNLLNTELISTYNSYQDYCPYLAKRGLTKQTCERFGIKYDPKYRQIIFPYYNEFGELKSLLKRSIDTKQFYIDHTLAKPLYCFDQIQKNKINKCIITEGLIDTLLGNQYGFPTIGTLGMPSTDQFDQINKSSLTMVYLMFDNDEAGRNFNKIFHNRLAKRIIIKDVYIKAPYKDIGDLSYEVFWKFVNEAENR